MELCCNQVSRSFGKKQVLKDLANSKGMSMTQATIEALESYYGINLTD